MPQILLVESSGKQENEIYDVTAKPLQSHTGLHVPSNSISHEWSSHRDCCLSGSIIVSVCWLP